MNHRSALRRAHIVAISLFPAIARNRDQPRQCPEDVPSLQRHGFDVIIMPGVDHFMFLENPSRLNGLLRTTIGKLTRDR